jgi:O-acetyl-ADP-ribose deacetylase (regulator of RNase III)
VVAALPSTNFSTNTRKIRLTGFFAHARITAEVLMSRVLREHKLPSGALLQIVQGDLTQENVDAIVNAANENLKHGGGVAGAIVRRGGHVIQEESDRWVEQHGPVSHSDPAYTSAGNLPARYVIHAVGPVWGSGDEDSKLAAAVYGSLAVADELNLASIAFPAISTGIFGFPKDRAASVMLQSIRDYFAEHPNSGLNQIRLTLYDQPTLDAFLKEWESQDLGN